MPSSTSTLVLSESYIKHASFCEGMDVLMESSLRREGLWEMKSWVAEVGIFKRAE